MISNQILQSTIDGLKGISRTELCVCDTEGKILAATFNETTQYENAVVSFVNSPAESQVIGGFQFFKVFDEHQLEYILIRYDKDNFIKNLLLDNLLLVDIYNRAKKLNIDTTVRRVVYIIETKFIRDTNSLEVVKELFMDSPNDFVTAVDERYLILVKELDDIYTYKDLDATAKTIIDGLEAADVYGVNIAYGTVVGEIKEVSRSYKEAKMALDVGRVFYEDENIVAYARLGIGRLIYQLPLPLCRMFIREIFDGRSPDDFDEETIVTIHRFFENSLNVSETSRQLYIHRNTLVYRLDKLQKATGLDLRVFEDAITFKIALMVVKYMKYVEKNSN